MSQYSISDHLIANVKAAEGLMCKAYKDTTGNWTAGYGHKLASGKDWTGYVMLPDMAAATLGVDLNTAAMEAIKLPEWPCLDTPCRQDSLVEIVYNMGAGNWAKFARTRACIADQEWSGAHDNLLTSLWATQVKGRAIRIAMQLYKGTYA